MKKHLYLFACMSISLFILTGCSNYSNSTLSVGKTNIQTKITPSPSVDTTDWKPTPYKTINNFDGVNMTVKKETVSSTKLTLVFKNNSDSQCIYGDDFYLEKKIKGGWFQVPVTIKGNYAFRSIGYNLDSRSKSERIVDWGWLYGSLDTGKYRIVKSILDFRGTGDYDTYKLAARFIIKNSN